MKLRIRPARAGDAAALQKIESCSSSPWSPKRLQALCRGAADPAPRAWVAEEGSPCGYLAYNLLLGEATIQNISVQPTSRRRGVASALLQYALQQWRDNGADCCLLEVRASNEPALALYRRFGFRRDGVRRDYYPSGSGREDAILMSLALARGTKSNESET